MRETIYLTINYSAGGKEAIDFGKMLEDMYVEWIILDDRVVWLDIIEEPAWSDETIEITGDDIFDLLKNEPGVHRLVRIPPHDSENRRHTPFCLVNVLRSLSEESLGWEEPIRSYTLHPYKLVKDHRTGIKTEDVQGVFNGHIDIFLNNEE